MDGFKIISAHEAFVSGFRLWWQFIGTDHFFEVTRTLSASNTSNWDWFPALYAKILL